MTLYGLWGAGGHGRETMPLLEKQLSKAGLSDCEIVFVVDDGFEIPVLGQRVVAASEFLADSRERFFNIAIADSRVREKIAAKAISAGAQPISILSELAHILRTTSIGGGAIISPFASITADTSIGRFFHGNCYSYVAHDSVIGDFVTFGPYVCCNGGVRVEDHVYIGAGALIRNSSPDNPIVIGEGAVVGMGAVVTKSVPPNTTVLGIPARPK